MAEDKNKKNHADNNAAPVDPLLEDFVEIKDLVKGGSNEDQIKKLSETESNLTKPGFLDKARGSTIALVRDGIIELINTPNITDEIKNHLARLRDILVAKSDAIEASDGKLKQMAEKIAPQEYENWCDLFQALHYTVLPGDEQARNKTMDFIKQTVGIASDKEYYKLTSALRGTAFNDYMAAKNPASALRKVLGEGELNDKNLAQKISEINKTLRGTIDNIKPKIKEKTTVKTEPVQEAPDDEKVFFTAVKGYLHGKPDEQKLFADALKLTSIEDNDPLVAGLQKKVKKLIEGYKSALKQKDIIPNELMAELFEGALKPLKQEITEALRLWQDNKDKEYKEFYKTLGLGEINKETRRLYAILGINPQTIKDPEKRKYLEDIQKDIGVGLEKIKQDYPPHKLKDLRLNDKKEKAKEIAQKLLELDNFIDFFEAQIYDKMEDADKKIYDEVKKTTTQSSAPDNNPPATGAGTEAPAGASTVIDSTQTDQKAADPNKDPNKPKDATDDKNKKDTGKTDKKEDGKDKPKDKASETPEEKKKKIWEMLNEIINHKGLVNKNNPVCLAIENVIMDEENNIDLAKLKLFLRNTEFLHKNINFGTISDELNKGKKDDEEKIISEDLTVEQFRGLETKLGDELEKNQTFLTSIQGQRATNADDTKDRKKAIERNSEIKRLTREVKAAITLKSGNTRYDSPRDVLTLVNIFMYKEGEGSLDELTQKMDKQIQTARETTDKWSSSWLENCTFFLKPTLKATLKAIGEDPGFSSLGDKPGNKLAELASIKFPFHTSNEINVWLNSIGGLEKHIETTIPRLIVYLENSIREGKASSLIITRRARKLVEELRAIQHSHFKREVEATDEKDPREQMKQYFKKLKKSSYHEAEINKSLLLKHNVTKSKALKGFAIGGAGVGITAGLMASAPIAAGALGVLGLTGLAERFLRKTKLTDDERKGLGRGAIRATVAGGLGALGLVAGSLALPVGIAGAAIGLASPEIGKKLWKHRVGIGKGATKGAVAGGKAAGKGIVLGAKAVGKTSLFALKYLTPLGFYFIPRDIKKTIGK